ncbi:deazapurine DNA modification protein DpdA family protein [Nocardia sp. NPDC003979]
MTALLLWRRPIGHDDLPPNSSRWVPIVRRKYVDHYRMYLETGVTMTGETVGVGSVCRRGSQYAVAEVIATLAPLGMRLHGFGLSLGALRLVGHLVSSSDTQAWSYTARRQHIRLPGCTHTTRPDPITGASTPTDCRNCFKWARAYRERALDAVRHAARTAAASPASELPPRSRDRAHRAGQRRPHAPRRGGLALTGHPGAQPSTTRRHHATRTAIHQRKRHVPHHRRAGARQLRPRGRLDQRRQGLPGRTRRHRHRCG